MALPKNKQLTKNFWLHEFLFGTEMPKIGHQMNIENISEFNDYQAEMLAIDLQRIRDELNLQFQKENKGVEIGVEITAGFRCLAWEILKKRSGDARLMATNIRFAQQLAITEQNRHEIHFDTLNKNYLIINAHTQQTIKTIHLDTEIDIAEINNLTDNKAVFIPSGGVIEAGDIVLINSKNQNIIVHIKPSGYVQITE